MNGASKFGNIKVEHIKQYDDMLLVTLPTETGKAKLSFTITGTFLNIVRKYVALRPANAHENLFLQYRNGKCHAQPIGQNKFPGIPRRIATYLKLAEAERYTGSTMYIYDVRLTWKIYFLNPGLSFRNTVANIGALRSTSVPREQRIKCSLDSETGNLKQSSVSCTAKLRVSVPSNKNDMNHDAGMFNDRLTKNVPKIVSLQPLVLRKMKTWNVNINLTHLLLYPLYRRQYHKVDTIKATNSFKSGINWGEDHPYRKRFCWTILRNSQQRVNRRHYLHIIQC